MTGKKAKLLSFLLITILVTMAGITVAETNDDAQINEITAYIREIGYQDYLAQYPDYRPDTEIIITATEYSSTDMDLVVAEELSEYEDQVLITGEVGYVEWEITVEHAGLYNLAMMYLPIEGRGVDIERDLWINGERPFDNAQYFKFSRIWGDDGELIVDSMGNEIRPRQIEKPAWIEAPFTDYLGYIQDPYLFYFNEGANTIRLVSRMEPMAIAYLKLYQHQMPKTYMQVQQEYVEQGYNEVRDITRKIQGQDSNIRSTPTVFAISDHGDPTVEPYHHAEIRLNSIGGYRWSQPGQWIAWEVDVPVSGLYKVAFKAKQDEKIGAFSSRRLYVNNEIPFLEASEFRIQYSPTYQMNVLADPDTNEPYLIYLPAGKNEIRLEVVLGSIADVLRQTEEYLYELNTIYRRIIMITSGNPDPMRTYELHKRIPAVIDRIGVQAEIFERLVDVFVEATGMEGEHTEILSRMARLLTRMYSDPERIPRLLSEFRDNLGAVGTWIYETREQPLQIDYFIVAAPNQEFPGAEPTFLQSMVHEIKAIVASYFREYDLVGDIADTYTFTEDKEQLTVWIGAGRDQAQILKQMIDNEFSPKTGIPVKLQLVPELNQILIRAAIAGTGPDVAIGLQVQDPVNFGMRGALHNLSEFEDFDEIMDRFMISSIVPFSFRDNVFALAAQQSFPIMFYRKDVLAELGLEVPKTWDDVYQMLPTLQKNGMSIGIASWIYQSMLYQRGEIIYKPDGVETNLDSETAIQVFTELTDLFSLYSLLITYNAENRFRLGEMPIVIEDYGLYNRLIVFAPELRGEWGFDLVPGTIQEDGTINHTVAAPIVTPTGSNPMALAQAGIQGPATAILSSASNKDDAWEFVKWWTSSEIQMQFGRELESLMGAAARYPTSNVEAFMQLPWSIDEQKILLDQWQWIEGTLEMPGGYYLARMYDWAFRAVVVDDDFTSPRETLIKYNRDINYELMLKRREFGLELTLDEITQEDIDLFWSRFIHIKPKEYR